jgi:methyl-accepting chemotaxis protein
MVAALPVVADEVRRLAERPGRATKQIAELVSPRSGSATADELRELVKRFQLCRNEKVIPLRRAA